MLVLWMCEDVIDFMRRCRETLSRALLVSLDVFSDLKVLLFECKNRLYVKVLWLFLLWEFMLLLLKNLDFDVAFGASSSGVESFVECEW